MHSDEENRPLLASQQQVRSRGRMFILIIVGILLLGALVGAAITFSMWPHSEPNAVSVGLNQTFSSRMNVEEIMTTLQKLQDIADANNGSRAAGREGYNVTGQYVIDTLNSYGYFKVERQDFDYAMTWKPLAKPTLAIVTPNQYNFTYKSDFYDFFYSGSGDVIANISVVQNVGCDADDWASFPEGNIALVLRGVCSYGQKTAYAMAAKTSALLVYNNNSRSPDDYPETLDNVTFPVLFLTNRAGNMLKDLHETQPVTLHVTASSLTTRWTTFNVLAEPLSGPSSGPVVVVGAHLDSVGNGPGINDNGSGAATLLALARIVAETKMFKQDSPAQLRLAWWGAEEHGLLGSKLYVNNLKGNHPDQFAQIALNLNFDMLGSPNFMRGIHNGTTAPEDVRHGSTLIQQLFEGYFQSQDLTSALVAFSGGSDYAPFIANGIPAGGLLTGAGGLKTLQQKKLFGGVANVPFDPCYHKACDTIDNINTQVLDEMSKSAAEVTATVLFNPSILTGINPKFAKNN